MGREGPCFHCGIKDTPLWRSGPPEKPVLCNACGSRWRTRGSLKDYIPSHEKLPLTSKPAIPGKVQNIREPKIGAEVASNSQYSASIEDDAKHKSWSGSSTNCIKMGSINGSDKSTASNPPVPKRKRSVPKQRILSPIQRFQRQLYRLSQEPEFAKLHEEQEDVLIYHKSSTQMPNEIGLGVLLLQPPPSPNN